MNKNDFLQNISRRLGRETVPTVAPERIIEGAPEFWTSARGMSEMSLSLFCESLTALGGEVQVCESLEEVQNTLQNLLQKLAPKRVATWELDEFTDLGLSAEQWREVLKPYETLEWGRCTLDELSRADVGITGCACAIADTGTLVMMAGPGRGRSVSLLPTVHIAIIRQSQIRHRMGEVMAELSPLGQMPSAVHFISGPSRSSDIENDQSIGVHGPAALYVLIHRDVL